MLRKLAAGALVLLALYPVAAAQPAAEPATDIAAVAAVAPASAPALGAFPTMPTTPVLPAYVTPLSLLGDLPAGRVDVAVAGGVQVVTYDAHAHTRLLLSLKLAERLSDDRARAAWRDGWGDGVEALLPRLDAERAARAKAEAEVLSNGKDTPFGDAVNRASWLIAGAFVVGVAAGLVAGVAAGGAP